MNRSTQLWDQLKKTQLVALLAPRNTDDCVRAFEILDPLGITLEIALRTAAAIDGIAAVTKQYPDALVMAGTVLTANHAQRVVDAGACGVVSPDFVPGVVEICMGNGVLCIPGGTADVGKQLAMKAVLCGRNVDELRAKHPHQWVYKLFPAMANEQANLQLVKAWKAVYPGLTVVYTGGVKLDNVGRLAASDPDGIFCGSALTKHLSDSDRTQTEAKQWLAAIRGEAVYPGKKKSAGKTVDPKTPVSESRSYVVTFGEIMLRLAPEAGLRFGQADALELNFGGAEANVAVATANLGLRSRFVTALPDHDIGQAAIDAVRRFGVDTGHIRRQGSRVGIYYLEPGAAQRPSKVIYDRAGSALSEIQPGQIDWDRVFADAAWFHWTGITPALSGNAAEVTAEALQAAKQAGVTVSVDLNYRAKLWTPEKAAAVMGRLMEYVDIVIGNEEDAAKVFGITAGGTQVDSGKLDVTAYREVTKELIRRFDLQMAAITLRQSHSASDNTWSACLCDGRTGNGEHFYLSTEYPIHIVDRVGGGDAFAAGLIYALISGQDVHAALEFGVAASCLKHSIKGDFNLVSAAEVEALAAGNTSGRIKR